MHDTIIIDHNFLIISDMIITPIDYVRNIFINGIVTPVHAHQVSLLLITYASVGKLLLYTTQLYIVLIV